jgi:hypothetical protein
VVTHNEQSRVTVLHCLSIKLERPFVEPSRPRLCIVFERQPEIFELLNLSIVGTSEVYNVGDSDSPKLFHVGLGLDCASKREPFAHEESFHRLAPGRIPNRPRRLYNLYFTNAGFTGFESVKSVICSLTVGRDF